ncbi:hypothetical protein niasHT_023914 [Heterodera trifolii]|uniref:Uncharacterized protein n=1 Tax=Heterodera trifolii TaxID=157864 RepID=A0ABD2JCL0_9BILA
MGEKEEKGRMEEEEEEGKREWEEGRERKNGRGGRGRKRGRMGEKEEKGRMEEEEEEEWERRKRKEEWKRRKNGEKRKNGRGGRGRKRGRMGEEEEKENGRGGRQNIHLSEKSQRNAKRPPFSNRFLDPNGFFVALFLSPFFSRRFAVGLPIVPLKLPCPSLTVHCLGGCLLEYPGGCAPLVPGYFANCYGGYCRRNKAKGLRTWHGTERNGRKMGTVHGRTDEQQKLGMAHRQSHSIPQKRAKQRGSVHSDGGECPRECLGISVVRPFFSGLPGLLFWNVAKLRSMFFRLTMCPLNRLPSFISVPPKFGPQSVLPTEWHFDNTFRGNVWCSVNSFERFFDMKKCFYESALRTIDYLEAEFDQMKKEDDKMKGEREEEGKGKKEENEREKEEEEEKEEAKKRRKKRRRTEEALSQSQSHQSFS